VKEEKNELAGMTRREFLSLSGAGMAGIVLGAIPSPAQGAEKKPKYGGLLRVGERYGSTGLDAHKNQFFMDYQNYLLMYNALTVMGPLPQVRIYPDVAKSWEISKDGREYLFSLQEGVKFHHGKEMDSGDVKYSIERVKNPATHAPRGFAFRWIDSVETVDKYQVKIRLKEPFGPFLSSLTIMNCPIIPADWEPSGTKPAPGTGPFVFKSFVPNESTGFTRFDNYWEVDKDTGMRLPYLKEIHIKKIVDEAVRWTALRAGDLDYINCPPRNIVLNELKKPTPGMVVVMPQPVAYVALIFNTTRPPFDQKKVREAIAFGTDKKELIQAAYWGMGEPVNNQPFSSRSRFYIPLEDRPVDRERARKLLAEAGFPNGFKTELLTFSDTTYVDASNAIVGQFQKIGIEATIKVIDRAPFFVSMRKGEFSIGLRGDSERLDPDDAYYKWFHSSEIDQNNWSRYKNKELDELLEKGRTKWNWEERKPIYREVYEIVKDDLPLLYLSKSIIPVAYREEVKGFGAGAATWFGYYGGGLKKTWLDK
jgi:peptide/nickel transport system substrate-binding protein